MGHSMGSLPKIHSQSVKNGNFSTLQQTLQTNANQKKPTLMAGSHIAGKQQNQSLQHAMLQSQLVSASNSAASNHSQVNMAPMPLSSTMKGMNGQVINQGGGSMSSKHGKKNSLSELYNIYMQPPNNFRSGHYSQQAIPLDVMSQFQQMKQNQAAGHLDPHNLQQSSIVEVSEASDSQTFMPMQQDNIQLLDQQMKKRGTASPMRNMVGVSNNPSLEPLEMINKKQNHGSSNALHNQQQQQQAQAQAQAAQMLLNQQLLQQQLATNPNGHLNFAFSNSFNTSLVVQNPSGQHSQSRIDTQELTRIRGKLAQLQGDPWMAMKSKQRLQVILGSLADVKRACQGEKEVAEMIDAIGLMTGQMVESLRNRKREVKVVSREQSDKMRADMQTLENQLFNTKVESETLKIDKRQSNMFWGHYIQKIYYEDQVNELQKKNTELKGNLETLKSASSLNQMPSQTSKRSQIPMASSTRPMDDRLPSSKGSNLMDNALLMSYAAGGGANESELLSTLQKTVEQNNQLIEENTLLNQHLEYARNKEGKLMYLIFKLHKRGYPVNQVFEAEVKAISTRRFANGNGGYQLLADSVDGGGQADQMPDYQSAEYQDVKGDSYIEFDSQASYSILGLEKAEPKPRPVKVPALDFGELPVYISSSSESSSHKNGAAKQHPGVQVASHMHQLQYPLDHPGAGISLDKHGMHAHHLSGVSAVGVGMSRDEEAMYSQPEQLSDEAIAQREASGMMMENASGAGREDYEGLEDDEDDEEAMINEVVRGSGGNQEGEDLGIDAQDDLAQDGVYEDTMFE